MNDSPKETAAPTPWKILIADDDADVHAVTRLALRGVSFQGRTLEFMDAYSGAETLMVLRDNPDTAIVFLDVIMESTDAGLVAARSIRDNGFDLVRIIIRTGFPGQAPESKVIVDYDIHDYKEKSGLSVQALFTSVISALRAYQHLVALEGHRRGLMSVLESVSWFDFNGIQRYIAGMLAEFSDLAAIGSADIVMVSRPSTTLTEQPTILAAMGNWQEAGEPMRMEGLPADVSALVRESLNNRQALSGSAGRTEFLRSHGVDLVVFAAGKGAFAQADAVLLEVFLGKVCQAVSNYRTYMDIEGDRVALVRGLALRAESWSGQAAMELERLAQLATAIASRLKTALVFPNQTDSAFLRDIGIAALLHDLGNEAIPNTLLVKDTPYTPDERELMETHVTAGIKSLAPFLGATRGSGALSLAEDIVSCHHERFDGSGYPDGRRGDDIPLAARVVAIADAYVAMTSARPHRPAMEATVARAEIKAGAGSQFDPRIVEAFCDIADGG